MTVKELHIPRPNPEIERLITQDHWVLSIHHRFDVLLITHFCKAKEFMYPQPCTLHFKCNYCGERAPDDIQGLWILYHMEDYGGRNGA